MVTKSRQAPLLVAALGALMMTAATADPASARDRSLLRCWQTLDPQTLVEVGHVQDNTKYYIRRQRAANRSSRPAALLLSYGSQRTAFSAGLLVGWGETGHRPTFDLVTAVGPSAVLAPFAFIGAAGDQAIAEAYHCSAKTWQGLVQRALRYLDQAMLERIRQGHLDGRRLLIALKGSAARPQTVWDIGKIAASRHPGALRQIHRIIEASVDLTTRVSLPGTPVSAGLPSERNHTFRLAGAGQPFLFKPELAAAIENWFVVHNSVLFNDEVVAYAGKRRSGAIKNFTSGEYFLRPVFDVMSHVADTQAKFRIAVVQPRRWFYPETVFDQKFMREVFLRAYRFARMGRLWQTAPPRK